MRVFWAFFLVGCVGDSSTITKDAAPDVTSQSDASADAPADTTSTTDASDAATSFCKSGAATGAAFCADFESVLNPGDGWDSVTSQGGTLTLDTIGALGSSRSSLHAMTSASGAQVMLSKAVKSTSLRSKAILDFDAYFAFPSWNGSTDADEFMTLVFSTTNVAGNYYVDIERSGAAWQTTNTGGVTKTFSDLAPNAWHHVTISWNGTAAPVALIITIDSNVAVNTTLPQYGTTAAPLTFDTVTINADAENLNTTPATQVHYDNVILRFP